MSEVPEPNHLVAPEFWETVRLLGRLLGRVIERDRGHDFLELIETIRSLAKSARRGGDWTELYDYLEEIPSYEVTDITRAFNQFLNLANIAEQHYKVRNIEHDVMTAWCDVMDRLSPERVVEALSATRVELVLTEHPTEVLRRTLILKYDAIAGELKRANPRETELERLITETWFTDELRWEHPTPQDEAKWGFALVENSLWHALPESLRDIDDALTRRGLAPLPIDVAPIKIASWMGGDRSANSNVTAQVTREVLMLSRWMAADLYLRDVDNLHAELSMKECNGEVRNRVGEEPEPYRAVLKEIRERLQITRDWAEDLNPTPRKDIYYETEALLEPLEACYRSLNEVGMGVVADGPLKDTLRRVKAFGVTLLSLDIRQKAESHAKVLDEITEYISSLSATPGSYRLWDENQRRTFLLNELESRRPLFPVDWPASTEVNEVLDTFRVIAEFNGAGIGQYIISGTKAPSDVLAVSLLLKECGVDSHLPVVPLFETLGDLEQSANTIDELLSIPWYRAYTDDLQIMISYLNSAKDAGQLAAAWGQYQSQEHLVEVANAHGVRLSIFHGRGALVSRGGAAAHAAIMSQPAGSVSGRLRVAEQGETIRFKLGDSDIARDTFMRYLTGTIEVSLDPPEVPATEWRNLMTSIADDARGSYRGLVVDTPDFVDYFRDLTPEGELNKLSLGSRPEHPRMSNDLSAPDDPISWVFAWTQVRLMLPAWLGTDTALAFFSERHQENIFVAMLEWPFFRTQMNALEMALTKIDLELVDFYANRLTPKAYHGLRDDLSQRVSNLNRELLLLKGEDDLLTGNPEMRDSITIRNAYLDPLHLIQAELIARFREVDNDQIAQALKITMAGIASGLCNS